MSDDESCVSMPPKPSSGYILYGKDLRKVIQQANPKATSPEIMKFFAEAWANERYEVKTHYNNLAVKMRAEYDRRMAEVKQALGNTWLRRPDRRLLKAARRIDRPSSPSCSQKRLSSAATKAWGSSGGKSS